MLIGIDASRAFDEQPTGTEYYAQSLVRTLVETRGDFRIRLYTRTLPSPAGLEPFQPLPPGVELVVMPFPRLWTHIRLAWEIERRPPDVLFVPSHVLPLFCPVPSVVTVHDLGYEYFPETHPSFDRWYLRWTTRRHVHHATALLADSDATRNDLNHFYQADPQRVHTVYPGRDETLAPVRDLDQIQAAKSRYGINGPYLLYLGTLQPRKNLVRLIAAFERLAGSAGCQLVLAGKKGRHFPALLDQVKTARLEDKVLFPGYVAQADKAALLSGALSLVFPSLYEGFGFPVLEAMSCGTPVLTSTLSSLPEIAGDAAILVDPFDVDEIARGMQRLITEDPLRQALVRRGFMQVKRFSWQAAGQQVWRVLEQVARKAGRDANDHD